MRLKADLTLLVVAIFWGSAFVAQRVAGQMGSVYLFNGLRYLLASVIVLPFALQTNRATDSTGQASTIRLPREQYQWMLVAGFVLCLGSALQQLGVVYTTAGNAGFITSLYVVLVPVVLFIFWREKTHWISILAVILAIAGAFFLSTEGSFKVRLGDMIELASALFWTVHVIILGKYASKFESVSFASGHFFISGCVNLVIGLVVEDASILMALPVIGAVLYRATLSVGLGYTLQVWGQKHTPPTDAALILGLEAVFAAIAAWFLLDQRLLPIQIIGCVIIFIAVLISQFTACRVLV